jgi:hypothetical protein
MLFAAGSSDLQMEAGGLNRRREALTRVSVPVF